MIAGVLRPIDLTAWQTVLLVVLVVIGIIALVGIILWDMFFRDPYD